jgi:hypothetical protein
LGKATTGSITRNTGEMPRTATEILPTNLADVVRAVLVVPAVRAALVVLAVAEDPVALVVPEDPVELAVRVVLVVLEDPAALVVPEDPVELAVPESLVALVVPEGQAVLVELVVSESPAVQVAPERELVQVEVGLVQGHRHAQLAVALRTKSVIAARHPDQVPLLAVEEDLAAAVAETTRVPAAAEAVIAWAEADTVAVEEEAEVTEPAAVAEDAAVAAEDAAVVADVEDKGGLNDEETNENKNKNHDFAENFSGRFCDPYFLFVNDRSTCCAAGQNGCAGNIAAKPKRIRLTEAGC